MFSSIQFHYLFLLYVFFFYFRFCFLLFHSISLFNHPVLPISLSSYPHSFSTTNTSPWLEGIILFLLSSTSVFRFFPASPSCLTIPLPFSFLCSLLPCLCVLWPFAFQRCYGNYQRLFYRHWTHARRTLRAGRTLTPWLDPRRCPGPATNSLPNWLFRAAVFISFMVIFMRLCYHWLAWPGLPQSFCACLCSCLSP